MSWRNIPILCYHNLDASGDQRGYLGHPLEHFQRHLDTIQELGFQTISAQHLLDICLRQRKLEGKYLLLTFDDCHLSQWLYAAPLLAARNMTAVFFAVADFLGEGSLRTPAGAPAPLEASDSFKRAVGHRDFSQFMNRDEMAALVQDFGMEIYAHSAAHQACFRNLRQTGTFSDQAHWTTWSIYPEVNPDYPIFERGSAYAYNGFWPRRPKSDQLTFRYRSDAERYDYCLQDFRRCFDAMRQINGAERQLFCWPWGQYDSLSLQALKEVGFAGAFTLERSRVGAGTDPYHLNRIIVGRTHDQRWLRHRLHMYSSGIGANIFFKYYRKQPEIRKVLYLTDSYKLSGGTRQLLNNVEAMSEYGIPCLVVAPVGSPVLSALSSAGMEAIGWDPSMPLLRAAYFLRRLIRKHGIDVVHTFHSKPAKKAVLAKLLGGGFKLFLNRGVIYNPNPLISLFAVIADGVICNSHKGADKLRQYLVPAQKIRVIYNSFSGATPPRTQARSGPLRVIYVGNDNPVKGHDVFLQTAQIYYQRYPQSDVLFVSYGIDDRDALAQYASQETVERMQIYGDTPHAEVLQALSQADVFVLSSRLESMPNVLLEAFSAGLPVVSTNVGGASELVQNGFNGFMCNCEDSSTLTDRIHQLVMGPDLRRRMGRLNQHLVTTYLDNSHKGYSLLRAYFGERISDSIPFQEMGTAPPVA